jgi:hypothetical protein
MKTFEMGKVSRSSLKAYDSVTLIVTKNDHKIQREVKNILNMSNQNLWDDLRELQSSKEKFLMQLLSYQKGN